MSKQEDDLRAEGAQELANRQMKRDLKLSEKLKNKYEKLATRAQDAANGPHIAAAIGGTGLGAFGGFKANRALREYTADWLDEKGERSWGAFMLADAMPVIGGAAVVFVGAKFIKNGAGVGFTAGLGAGTAFGSMISSVFVAA